MNFPITPGLIMVLIAIISHAVASVWWAAKMTAGFDNLRSSLDRIDRELEKRDIQIEAIWKKVDAVQEKVYETRNKIERILKD